MSRRVGGRVRFGAHLLLFVPAWIVLIGASAAGQTSTVQNGTMPAPTGAVTARSFEVASIRENKSDEHARSHIISDPRNGKFTTINVPLKMLLPFAFGLPETQIVGLPGWAGSEKFDIEARADSSVDDQLHKLDSDQGKLLKQQMIQALLADRFKLKVHQETRELPIFALVTAKSGPKLAVFKANGTNISASRGRLAVQGGGDNTMALFTAELAKIVGRVVVDKTGIMGRYDVALSWTPDALSGGGDAAQDGPSIFIALQEQLGLKLEPDKGPVPVLVVDHVEAPSEN